jgi:hypothetical protein
LLKISPCGRKDKEKVERTKGGLRIGKVEMIKGGRGIEKIEVIKEGLRMTTERSK